MYNKNIKLIALIKGAILSTFFSLLEPQVAYCATENGQSISLSTVLSFTLTAAALSLVYLVREDAIQLLYGYFHSAPSSPYAVSVIGDSLDRCLRTIFTRILYLRTLEPNGFVEMSGQALDLPTLYRLQKELRKVKTNLWVTHDVRFSFAFLNPESKDLFINSFPLDSQELGRLLG